MVSGRRCVVQRAMLRDDELLSTPLQERNFTLPGLINNRYWQERVGSLQPYLVSDAAGGDFYSLVMDSEEQKAKPKCKGGRKRKRAAGSEDIDSTSVFQKLLVVKRSEAVGRTK